MLPEIAWFTTVSALLTALHIPHAPTKESINTACQQHLLRPAGLERWQIADPLASRRAELMPYFKALGLCDAVTPPRAISDYDYLIILGTTTEPVHELMEEVGRLLADAGRKKPQVVLLTGERPLDPSHEDMAYGPTEDVMMEAVYREYGLERYAYRVIRSPMKGAVRPNTDDTVYAWLATNPQPGRCLVVTVQPLVLRQGAVVATLLPKDFLVDTVGVAAHEDEPMVLYLDELARTVYQMLKLEEKQR